MHKASDGWPQIFLSSGYEDWFRLSISDVRDIGLKLLPQSAAYSIRSNGAMSANGVEIIGVDDHHIATEIEALASIVTSMLCSSRPRHRFLAAAFYHLRFEAIHPFVNGNGRVGRFILAAQCADSDGELFLAIVNGLIENERYYKSVFLAECDDVLRYQVLVDLIARISGRAIEAHDLSGLVFAPKFCQRSSRRFRFRPASDAKCQ